MGLSWIAVYVSVWLWLFHEVDILFGSRKKDLVDKTGDKVSIFWKIDFVIDWLPKFMRPPRTDRRGRDCRTNMHWENPLNGSTIDGESTNDNFGRGNRRTVVWPDEFASVPDGNAIMEGVMDTSPCVIPFSTPKGTQTEFRRLNQNKDWGYIFCHWSEHPEKRIGLYRVTDVKGEKKLEIIDKDWHNENPDYEFIMEPGLREGLRSVWYDVQWRQRSRLQLAQEVDGDDNASANQFFDVVIVSRIMEDNTLPAVDRGDLIYSTETYKPENWRANQNGLFKLWFIPKEFEQDGLKKYRPDAKKQFSVGADIAVGTGASNSTLHVIDNDTKETVATFACPNMRPHQFAELTVAFCLWMNEAYLIWESNGPGKEFGQRVMELGYRNVYYRRQEDSLKKTQTDVAGWWSSGGIDGSKRQLLGELSRAVECGEFKVLDVETLGECPEIVLLDDGSVGHSAEKNNPDSSGAKSNHADRVIAAALAWKGACMRPYEEEREEEERPSYECAKRRRLEWEDEQRKAEEW